MRRLRVLAMVFVLLGVGYVPAARAANASDPLPTISPTPQQIQRVGDDLILAQRVELVVDDTTDRAARELLVDVLRSHGVQRIDIRTEPTGNAAQTVHLGPADRPDVAEALAGVDVPETAEGYALQASRDDNAIALGGVDETGQFYAVQTFRQLLIGERIAGVAVSDYPAMPLRGTIEGFYGSPWTHAERLDQLAFYGEVKANTYVYAPKDDPYHRERWREPYPADKLAELGELVDQATANHVRFTFALSPGTSICYSDPADRTALTNKLQAMYDLGVRAFSIPLDDISYTEWNCDQDRQTYGEPGQEAAARAQVELLNDVHRNFIESRDGTQPLQMVPTEYGDLTESPYKQTIRTSLDPDVLVMWTGTDVVPPSITVDEARQASELFGRDVFVWDNYPVNDYSQSAGRLLLAPYDKREPGLSNHLNGIVSNPMNQAAASKVAIFTIADFSWNDSGYDRATSWRQAAAHLTAGDRRGTLASLVFFDLNHLAPTFGAQPWQPQSPELTERIERFWPAYDSGDRPALERLGRYFERIEGAPATIRQAVIDDAFLDDAANWLDATELWGRALLRSADVLRAIEADDPVLAERARAAMDRLADEARKIRSVPGENRFEGPVQIGDGVIDVFLDEVATRHDEYQDGFGSAR